MLSVHDVKDNPLAVTQTTFLKVKVLKRSAVAKSSHNDRMSFTVTAADTTEKIDLCVYDTSKFGVFAEGNTVMMSDIIMRGNIAIITSRTKVYRTGNIILPASVIDAECLVNLEVVQKSPVKSTFSGLTVKITKISPSKMTTVRATNESISMRSALCKDSTGRMPLTLWKEAADSDIEKGDTIKISKVYRSIFNDKPTLSTSAGALIEKVYSDMLPDISDSDTSSDTECSPQTFPAIIQAIESVSMYASCDKNSCFRKKLSDNVCPKCGCRYENPTMASVAKLVFSSGSGLVTYTLFNSEVQSLLDGEIPNTREKLENMIVALLPCDVRFKTTSNNIISFISVNRDTMAAPETGPAAKKPKLE